MDNDLRLLAMHRIQSFHRNITQRSDVGAELLNLRSDIRIALIAETLGVMPEPASCIVRIDHTQPWRIDNIQWGLIGQPTRQTVHERTGPFSPTAQCGNCKSYRTTTVSTYLRGGTRSHRCLKCQHKFKTAMAELDVTSTLPPLIAAPPRKPTLKRRKYNHDGKSLTVSELSPLVGVNRHTIYSRLDAGWSIERATSTPVQSHNAPKGSRYTYCGADWTLRELAELSGVNRDTIAYRLERGLSVEDAVKPGRMMHATYKHAKRIEHDGKSRTIKEWSAVTGIPSRRIRNRLAAGWALSRIINEPAGARQIEHAGEKKTIREWATYSGIRESTLRARLSDGWDIGLALQQKPQRRGISHKDARMIEHDGKSLSVRELASRTGRGVSTIYRYLTKGWDIASALSHREPAVHQIEFGGECLTTREWSSRTGITRTAIVWRIKAGWSAERILTTPVSKSNRFHKDGERVDGNGE